MIGFRLRGDIRRRRRSVRNDFLRQGRTGRSRPPPRYEFPPQLLVFAPQCIAFRFQLVNLRRQRRHDGFSRRGRRNRLHRRICHHHAAEQVRTHEQRNAPATEAAAPSVFQSVEHRHDHCFFVGQRLYHKTPSPSHRMKKRPTVQTKHQANRLGCFTPPPGFKPSFCHARSVATRPFGVRSR